MNNHGDILHYLPGPEATATYGTAALRKAFLVGELFDPGAFRLIFTDMDRMAVGAASPKGEALAWPNAKLTGQESFHAMRESGVLNLGGRGVMEVDGTEHVLENLDCLYVGRGVKQVRFLADETDAGPAFHLLSCPAHADHPTTLIKHAQANRVELGDTRNANVRTIFQYIHEGGAASCQLVMGYTELAEGSVWNTFPPHTHSRRCEVYTYFDTGENPVMHFMGEPTETRHLVVREKQSVLSPPWSIHCGSGTAAYKFVWGMAGENQQFTDMDAVDPKGVA